MMSFTEIVRATQSSPLRSSSARRSSGGVRTASRDAGNIYLLRSFRSRPKILDEIELETSIAFVAGLCMISDLSSA